MKVTVVTNHKLTEQEMRAFDSNAQAIKLYNFSPQSDSVIYSIPVDENGGGITVGGPYYRTFYNTVDKEVVRYAVNYVGAYVASRVPTPFWAAVVEATTQFFVEQINRAIPDASYWGFWQTKAYSSYWGYYQFFNTEVRYANSNYTGAVEVYYYDTGFSEN
ncbi:hypothetical protein [Thermicanus aegyptius]|uniref:hypothetical protein n=1 Tax=Thermicanus aegyptius TaxID=94009 RepID=UPI00048E6761|nr:hypothetical protein [Thermicanus aegyptius]